MRLITILIILLIGVIGFGLMINDALSNDAEQLTNDLNRLQQAIKQDNWSESSEILNHIEMSWSKSKNWWAIVIDHQEIDYIDFSLSKIKSYLVSKDDGPSLAELSVLIHIINHIPAREAVTLRNIL